MGDYDIVAIYEAPDDAVAARFNLQLGMLGNIRTRTLKAFPEAAFREIINSLDYEFGTTWRIGCCAFSCSCSEPGYSRSTLGLPRIAASGEKVFVQCKACHQIGENAKNAVGPMLNGLFGRKAGTIEGYSYSPANKNSGITWDEASVPRIHQGSKGQDTWHQDDFSRLERSKAN